MTLTVLTKDEWAALSGLGPARRFRRGQVLFREGDPGGAVLAIQEGRAKVSVVAPNGTEIVLGMKEPGDLLGELSAIDGRPRSATAVALDPVTATSVNSRAFNAFLESHPRVALQLLRLLSEHLRETTLLTVERDAGDTATRAARRLVVLADRFGEHRGTQVDLTLGLTQDDLAAWIGATREATSRALRSLREKGLIETGRQRITVVDLAGLRGVASLN